MFKKHTIDKHNKQTQYEKYIPEKHIRSTTLAALSIPGDGVASSLQIIKT